MALNKLDNFIKNTEGRILYVNPSDLDATDAITNQGNSLTKPFKTIQRALLEAARFSYVVGSNNDITEKTTILLFPGIHTIDNRPGYAIQNVGGTAYGVSPSGSQSLASSTFSLTLASNFDLTQSGNILYTFNSINGGVIVPRGTSIVGLDLRKTKLKPLYVPNPTDSTPNSSIFRITGACYFWQFSLFDADPSGLVYTNNIDFSTNNQSTPSFSHHKLTCFEYADGVNIPSGYTITDLDMYYAKLSNAFNVSSGRDIPEKYPTSTLGFAKQRPEWEIVGAFATDPINISSIISGDGSTPSTIVTVTTSAAHNLQAGTPIKINGVTTTDYNISTTVQNVISSTQFTYLLPYIRINLPATPSLQSATVTIETDTVGGASPYIFNISLRSVWGMNGMHADGSKASGFRSMVVAQFTGVSLQRDDRAFVQYNQSSRSYQGINYTAVSGALLASGSSSTDPNSVYHLNPNAIYRDGWTNTHIKISNDAFIQVVSVFAIGYTKHFEGLSGADVSITNSNSNFGQNSLAASGFKNAAFAKDDTGYVTSIIGPRAIVNNSTNSVTYSNIPWVQVDSGLTTSVGISSHLYLYGYTTLDNPPPNIVQGYRIGANYQDKLYAVSQVDGVGINSAFIYMTNNVVAAGSTFAIGGNISQKSYPVSSGPGSDQFNNYPNTVFTIGAHGLQTGETIRIFSDTGDLPENISEDTVYYVIAYDQATNLQYNQIQIASSPTNANVLNPITVYGGSSLTIVSRVSDKNPGDLGSPLQFDPEPNGNTNLANWFLHVNQNNTIYSEIANNGVANLGSATNISYISRANDSRSIDEKIYKLRVVIPKETLNARDPVEGYVIQDSGSTGPRTNSDFSLTTLTSADYAYNRNPRFISTCSVSSNTVTVVAELAHHLQLGDTVNILNVTDTSNTAGTANVGYNGKFSVSSIVDDKTFKYSTTDIYGTVHTPGSFTNNVNVRSTTLPRFQRNNLQSNYYIYRNEIISNYVYGKQDGIYHLYVLNSKNTVPTGFTGLQYSQNVVNLYPQMDRDNLSEDPRASSSFALRFPLGQVATNDKQKSITRETTDQFMRDFGVGLAITAVSTSSGITTISFDRAHGLSGIVTYTGSIASGSGHNNGTFYNVKLYNNSGMTSWNGATSQIVVSSGIVTYAQIMSPGSAYTTGQTLYFDTSVIGGSADATINITTAGITTALGNVVQITGSGTTVSGYYRINTVPATNQISVAQTSGDPIITASQYAFVVGPSIKVLTPVNGYLYSSTTGISTFNFPLYHGLLSGNRFRVLDLNNNNLGDYIVNTRNSITGFTAYTGKQLSPTPGYILKHGLSANNATSDVTGENVGVRDVSFFANDELVIVAFNTDTQIRVTTSNAGYPTAGIGTASRFPLGTYIQVDNEIMRIISSSLSGGANDEITVIRGALGTFKESHDVGSLIKKINPIAVEFRRPSVVRSSNQTFEYLGYGPGNYSTALPQLQVNNLPDTQIYLAQAQQKSGGTVVYTGMNNNGDFYIGNKKLSSKTGQEIVFDAPIPSVRGETNSALSVVYDEVTIKQRLIVEGGNSGNLLSQFNGPLTINGAATINANTNITGILNVLNKTNSSSTTTGSVVISGGVGIGKNVYIGGNVTVTGTINSPSFIVTGNSSTQTLSVSGIATLNAGLNLSTTGITTGNLGSAGANGVFGIYNTSNNGRIDLITKNSSGIGSTVFSVVSAGATVYGNLNVYGTETISGNLNVTGDITAFYTSDQRLKENIVPIPNALNKVLSISGNNYDWVYGAGKEGSDVGVIAQEILEVLPEAVTTRETGYLAVRYEKIIPLLIEAVKDLSNEIKDLRNQINNK
jgi:Chaperone of endosialidase